MRTGEVKDQLDLASSSIPLNIAEGNGNYTPKDRCRFLDIAHGSALQSRCRSGYPRGQRKGEAGRYSPWKREPSENSPHAYGSDQEEFSPRIRQRQGVELTQSFS